MIMKRIRNAKANYIIQDAFNFTYYQRDQTRSFLIPAVQKFKDELILVYKTQEPQTYVWKVENEP